MSNEGPLAFRGNSVFRHGSGKRHGVILARAKNLGEVVFGLYCGAGWHNVQTIHHGGTYPRTPHILFYVGHVALALLLAPFRSTLSVGGKLLET